MALMHLSEDMAWTTKLHAYDDGLGSSRQARQILRFSDLSEKSAEMDQLKKDLRENATGGTIHLPHNAEIATGTDPKHEGVWVGWYLPLTVLPLPNKILKGMSVKSLVRGDTMNKSQSVKVFSQEQAALKVICRMHTREKGTRYYALARPDPYTGICKAFLLGKATSVFFHREFRDDELTSSERREGNLKIPIREITNQGASSSQPKQAVSDTLQGEGLLSEVYAHLVEYSASKDARHIEAATTVIEEAVETDTTPWVRSIHLQMLLQKKPITPLQAHLAVEELFTLYPNLDKEEMSSLTDDVVAKVSFTIFRQPDRYNLTWATLRLFMTVLAVRLKNSHSENDDLVETAMDEAFKVASMDSKAGTSAPLSYQITDDSILNFVTMEIKVLQKLLASYAGASRALSNFVKSLPGQWGMKEAADKLQKSSDRATAHIASENYLHALGLQLKVIQDEHLSAPLVRHVKRLRGMIVSIREKAEKESEEENELEK